jgi:hypothetical protein
MELQACGPGAGMTGTGACGGHREWEGVTPDGLEQYVAVVHPLIGRVEAHGGRGVHNTSDVMTMIGVGSGDHDVSKSRQTAAS